jgi:preprotein translocase subunit Sec63
MLTYGATDKEIKAAYRKLSIELHPDKNPDQSEEDAQRFKQVCSRMLKYAHVCSRLLTYAHVCSRMLTYARVCSRKQVTQGYKILSDPEKKKRWLNHEAVDDKGIPAFFLDTLRADVC